MNHWHNNQRYHWHHNHRYNRHNNIGNHWDNYHWNDNHWYYRYDNHWYNNNRHHWHDNNRNDRYSSYNYCYHYSRNNHCLNLFVVNSYRKGTFNDGIQYL